MTGAGTTPESGTAATGTFEFVVMVEAYWLIAIERAAATVCVASGIGATITTMPPHVAELEAVAVQLPVAVDSGRFAIARVCEMPVVPAASYFSVQDGFEVATASAENVMPEVAVDRKKSKRLLALLGVTVETVTVVPIPCAELDCVTGDEALGLVTRAIEADMLPALEVAVNM
jgi:hypothetical protein